LVSAVCSALLLANLPARSNAQVTTTGQLDPTQVYTTPNIVQPTVAGSNSTPWVNGVYQNNLTCWAFGLFGYCGPNPIVRPDGNINFSYGWTDLYQQQAIANVLPNSGAGLRVNGYNFGFTAKNGNGWDDGRTDILYAYVQFNDPTGKSLLNHTHNLTYQFNWTTFNYSETFATPYASKDLGSVRYGFVGKDNNFWAGPYGPEINNVNFSLKYSVDPCSYDVLSSPTCPGYLDALAKLAPPTPTLNSTNDTLTAVTTAPSILAPTTNTSSEIVAPVATTASLSTTNTNTPAAVNIATSPTISATPTASNPQPKVGEVQTSSAPKSTVSTSQILSIIANEQSRIGGIEKSVVQEAVQQAQAAGAAATAQAEAVAAQAQAQSIAASISTQSSSSQPVSDQRGQVQSFSISPLRENNPTSLASLNAAREQSLSSGNQGSNEMNGIMQGIQIGLVAPTQFQQLNRIQESSFAYVPQQPITYSLAPQRQQENEIRFSPPPVSLINNQRQVTVDAEIKSEGLRFGERNILDIAADKTKQEEQQSQQQASSTVKKNVKDNDAAVGVTIASIANQPAGYDAYFSALQDRPFYPPKEVYRNQKVVDNVRLLRGLTGSGDRLHQQMIEQQYNK
jgi:hypothetical protein